MPSEEQPDLSLFLDILKTLEKIDVPYMIIGAFAGIVYGVTRVTYDIDIVVDLQPGQIEALSAAYPLPRYYADPVMIYNSVKMGIMFNIIDSSRGEKADLVPLTPTSDYFDESLIDQGATRLGAETSALWQRIKLAARHQANRGEA